MYKWLKTTPFVFASYFDVVGLVTCEKSPFLSNFYIKAIILPRQARDKHRESTQKKMPAFFAPPSFVKHLKKLYMALHAAPNRGPFAKTNAERQTACIVSPAEPTSRRCTSKGRRTMTHTPARSTPAWCQSSQLLSIAICLYLCPADALILRCVSH
jgi:hypothetical protein